MSKLLKFPLDGKTFKTKASMYSYIEETYPDLLNDDMSPSRLYFNLKYKKTCGKCVMTGKPTRWNDITERYERFADEKAKESYRAMFKLRMLKKYGKVHILDDPEQQKKMLDRRVISIPYKFADGQVLTVNSKLEEHFLGYVESAYNFNRDCFTEPPTIYYSIDSSASSFYLPDFYIPSLNLIIEIKGTNPHYQERDSYKEKLKKEYTIKEGFNFVQIDDKNYIEFNKFFLDNVINN